MRVENARFPDVKSNIFSFRCQSFFNQKPVSARDYITNIKQDDIDYSVFDVDVNSDLFSVNFKKFCNLKEIIFYQYHSDHLTFMFYKIIFQDGTLLLFMCNQDSEDDAECFWHV